MSFRSTSIVLVIALSSWSATAGAQADPAAAEALFREGRALMAAENYAEACQKFESSQRLDPALGTLMNLADCYEKNGQTASAWARFAEAVTEAVKAGDKAREKVANARVNKLEPKLSKLSIEVPDEVVVEGLQIRRGDVVVERAQWGVAIPVDPGTHTIVVSAPGKRRWSKQVEVSEPGATQTVTIEALEDAAVEPATSNAEVVDSGAAVETSASDGSLRRTLGMLLVGAGAVGIGVGGYFGITAKNRWDDAQERCPNRDRCDAEGAELSRDAKSAADISTIAFIAGAAAVGGGLVLWLGAPSSAAAETRSARIGIAPVAPGGAGGSLVGRF